MDNTGPVDSKKDTCVPRVPIVLNPGLAQSKQLRELARSWYALSVACRCMGAKVERVAKDILYEATSISTNINTNVSTHDNSN